MLLSELVADNGSQPSGFRDVEIRGLTADSRNVQAGFLFAALEGSQSNGKDFIPDALRQGAVAILLSSQANSLELKDSIILVRDQNPRRKLALMAGRFYRSQPQVIAAVTGTNGKSSVAEFTRQIWQNSNNKAASIGTLGLVYSDNIQALGHTTPEPISLHKTLDDLAKKNIDHVIVEASSHGLDQCRLDGANVIAAAYLNISHDHLDYHLNNSDYFTAKASLFSRVIAENGTAILNADDNTFNKLKKICEKRNLEIITFGSHKADISLVSYKGVGFSQELLINCFGNDYRICLNLPGKFQVYNVLAAIGLAIATGVPVKKAILSASKLKGVRGRLELIGNHPSGAPILVDYAHSAAALANVLKELRRLCCGRLVVVFGCGGNRDKEKRAEMGSIAGSIADKIFITDDNPRTESADAIRLDILSGCPNGIDIGDRKKAISSAISSLSKNDLLLVAGKGHEETQILGVSELPFDDALVIRSILEGLEE